MKVYIFIYNVVAIKIKLSSLQYENDSKFILIGSDYCIKNLSDNNRSFFHEIHCVDRNFHRIDSNLLEQVIQREISTTSPADIALLTNEDSTQLVCSHLREKYHIPGCRNEAVLPYVNKDICKKILSGAVTVPRFCVFDKKEYKTNAQAYIQQVISFLGFPMFIKPVDLVSSMGTFYVPDEHVLKDVLEDIFHQPWKFEIDEFIDGDLFHCDVIVADNEIKFFTAGQYANPLARFSKGKPMGSIPVIDSSFLGELRTFSETVLNRLGIFSSAFHIEVFRKAISNELVFLEAASRTPGALVPEMYERVFNVHLERLHFQAQIQLEELDEPKHTGYQAGWITYPQKGGKVVDLYLPSLAVDHEFMSYVSKGQQLKQAETLLDGACSALFWDASSSRVEEAFELLKFHQPLIMEM